MSEVSIHISISGLVAVADLTKLGALVRPFPNEPATAVPPADGRGPTEPKAEAPAKEKPTAKTADKPKGAADADAPTLDDVKTALKAYDAANGRDAMLELLGSYGVKNVSALPEEQYAEFIEKCGA